MSQSDNFLKVRADNDHRNALAGQTSNRLIDGDRIPSTVT
jgi:hypothetical protein